MAADILPWILVAVGWTLAVVGISFTVYFGLKARKSSERLDSYLRANARLGQVFPMAGGRAGKVVERPDGMWGVEYTRELSDTVVVTDHIQAEKIPAEKDEEEEE